MDVKEQIRKYSWDFENWEPVRSLFAFASMPEVFAALSDMIETDVPLGSNHGSDFYTALAFIQEVGQRSPHDIRKPFRNYFVRSRLLKRMRFLLFSENIWVRRRVLAALDKLTIESNGTFFENAFYQFYASDPLWIPCLLSALSWAGRREVYIDAIRQHPHYLVGWSILDFCKPTLSDSPGEYAQMRQRLDFYLHAENPWVRAEAEHYSRELASYEQSAMMTKQEKRQRRKEIEKLKPKLDWFFVSLRFDLSLSATGKTSYTLEEFERFVEDLVATEVRAMQYLAIFEPGRSNWSAYIPDLPGCIATGKDQQEVRQNIAEALELHLAGMREDGDPIPEPSGIAADYVSVGSTLSAASV